MSTGRRAPRGAGGTVVATIRIALGAALVVALVAALSVVSVVSLVATAPPAAAAAPLGTVTNYGLGVRDPYAITAGPDGNVWFTDLGNDAIGRVTPAGVVTTFTDSTIRGPRGIVAGPDGNLWFTNTDGDSIGRVTPAGVVTNYTDATVKAPWGIAAGSDGRLWFTNSAADSIGSLDPTTFAIAEHSLLTLVAPRAIVAGPDGNLWFTSAATDAIHNVTTAGAFTTFTDAALHDPRQLAAGPDGNVWFTDAADEVGLITPAGAVTTYPNPDPAHPVIVSPQGITAGPDGNLWFTNHGGNTIGRVTPAGALTAYPDATVAAPWGIAAGADGHLWFANRGNDSLGHLDPATFAIGNAVGSGVANPESIVAGPDGNLWFTNFEGASIGRITPAGTITTFTAPGVVTPAGITVGADGNLWFTNVLPDSIGRITTAGVITTFTDPSINGPFGITTGPDGNVWFTNAYSNSIGRLTPAGVITRYLGPGISFPTAITTGADGNLWFTNRGNNSIGRIDPTTFAVSNYTGAAIAGPQAIVAGPDGNLWFTNNTGSTIGRITLAGVATSFTDASIRQPLGLTVGPDENLWFTNDGGDSVGTISVAGAVASFTGAGVRRPRGITSGPDGNVWFTNANSSIASVGAGPAPAGLTYHSLSPVRVLDSRGPTGGWSAKLQAGSPRTLHVPGTAGVPAGAQALVLNVTATQSTAASFLTVYPTGGSVPNASNLNVAAGQTIPNLVTVRVGTGGDISFATALGATDVVADVVGYFDAAGGERLNAVDPARILDSRGSVGGWGATPLVAGTPRDLTVTGVAGVPVTATAVTVNVTATNGSAGSFLTLYPAGGSTPNASNVNFAANETIPNLAIVQVGAGGAITIANAIGFVDVVVDVVGYFDASSGDYFHPMYPTRVLDSRGANGGWRAPLVAGAPRTLGLGGARGVPPGAHAVAGNVTVTNATAPSFLTVHPAGGPTPNVSNLNYAAGQTIPNHVTIKLGAQGAVAFSHAVGSVDVVVDLVGYYAST